MDININLTGVLRSANNLSDVASAATSRTNLGATTVGANLFTATNPGAVTWMRVNADNTVSFRTAAQTLSDIGAEAAIAAGTTAQYWRGDKSWQTLNTTAVTEGTNLYFTEARVRSTTLTGLSITGSSITSTDTVLQAFGKVQNQINALVGGVNYQGTWNATTNSPALASGTGTKGYYYVVSVAGSTNLDGITDWKLGDWAIFNGTTWEKVDNTDAVISVNGYTGAVTLVKADIGLGNVENTALSTWAGSTNITTLGTITTGTLSTGAVIGGVTMTLGSDASYDLYYRNASGVLTRLANGTTGQILTATTGAAPSWGAAAGGISIGDTIGNSPVTGSVLMAIGGVVTQSISYRAQQGTPFATGFGAGVFSAMNATTALNNTAVGYNAALALTTGDDNTYLGYTAGSLTTTAINQTLIGSGARSESATTSNNATAIGYAANAAQQSVCIGSSTVTTTGEAVAIGHGATAANASMSLGYTATGSGTNALTIGYGAVGNNNISIALGNQSKTTASNQVVIGAQDNAAIYYTDFSVGGGVTSGTARTLRFRTTSATGSNVGGWNMQVEPGAATGSGTPGTWAVRTSTTLGSGTTLQTLVSRLTISGGAVTTDASTATWADALDFVFSGTTGTKFGTATSQKMGWYNAAPVIQQTTASAAATFVANTSLIANDTATFDGYTMGQVIKILRTYGFLA